MKKEIIAVLMLTVLSVRSCDQQNKSTMFDRDNIIAWCIVPFDAMERGPEERAAMLRELGISMFAYDYRDKHIPQFESEIRALEKEGIDLTAVWLWIQDLDEHLLDPASEAIVRTVERTGTSTCFWVSFPDQFFYGLDDDEKLQKATGTLSALNGRLLEADCSIALYNHGDWFGEPENQVKIIREIGSDNIGIVYNFHHAHHQVDRFPEIFDLVQPYLVSLNINGMNRNGPKILPVGSGEEEPEMLRYVRDKGYNGPIGILGHTEGRDIRHVLQENLEGLEKLAGEL